MVADFVVLDLESQAEAVARYVKDWTRRDFLGWLSQFGDVRQAAHDPDSYLFFSHVGLDAAFRINERGDFILILLAGPTMQLVAEGVFSS